MSVFGLPDEQEFMGLGKRPALGGGLARPSHTDWQSPAAYSDFFCPFATSSPTSSAVGRPKRVKAEALHIPASPRQPSSTDRLAYLQRSRDELERYREQLRHFN